MSRFLLGCKVKGWFYFILNLYLFIVLVDKKICLFLIWLFGSENNKYLVKFEVIDVNGVVLLIKMGIFMFEFM